MNAKKSTPKPVVRAPTPRMTPEEIQQEIERLMKMVHFYVVLLMGSILPILQLLTLLYGCPSSLRWMAEYHLLCDGASLWDRLKGFPYICSILWICLNLLSYHQSHLFGEVFDVKNKILRACRRQE